MNFDEFPFPMEAYGLPSREQLKEYRIWDGHYHGLTGGAAGFATHPEVMRYVDRMGIERVFALDIASGSGARTRTAAQPFINVDDQQRELLEKERHRLAGMIRINPAHPEDSCAKMEQWIRNGPCIGIKYAGSQEGVRCSHPNNDPILRLAKELGAVVYVHAWLKVGGNPRRIDGDNGAGESTPMDVTLLAERFPDVPIICGHSGGDWELGARAVRRHENVMFEFAGSDPHSGSVDYAHRILGENRLVWGGHGPSRCLATELSKVLESNLTQAQRMKIFGRNLRRICAPIMRRKGYTVDV